MPSTHDLETTHPFYSIALPAYNAAGTLGDAIASVQDQTFTDWELIVVDDGSTDGTGSIADQFARSDERIIVISQANAGCGAARNVAIDHARGPWIVRFDADDLLRPDFLERVRHEIETHPDAEIVSPTGLRTYADGREEVWCPDPRYREPRALTLDDALHGWCPVFTHSAFRRSLWERIGGIRPDAYAEDYDMWARAIAAGAQAWFFPEALSVYGCGESNQMSARGNRIAECYLETLSRVAADSPLSPEQGAAVRRRIGQLRRRVAVRRAAMRVLGERRSERLADAFLAAVRRRRGQRSR
jgi:glycosyltransferase involved in cell wall biosynthesis